MAAVRSTFSALLAPGLRKVFFHRYDPLSQVHPRVFKVNTSKRKYEDDQGLTGFGLIPEKAEAAAISYEDPMQGYSKRYTHLEYALGFRVSLPMWEDDLYGIMRRMSGALGRSVGASIETLSAGVLNDGFTDTGPDALSLFNASHTLKHGGTSANRPSTDADLAVASLEAGLTAFRNMRDDNNIRISVRPTILLVSPNDEWTALKLVQSEKVPFIEENTKNILPSRGLQVIVWDYLTDTDAWFLLSPPDDRELNFFWRRRPQFQNGDDFDTKDAKFSVTYRCSVGYSDWRGTYGSRGA